LTISKAAEIEIIPVVCLKLAELASRIF
jgi:hypothetical protein